MSWVDLYFKKVTPAALWRVKLRWAGGATLAEKTVCLSWGDCGQRWTFPLSIFEASRDLHVFVFHTGPGLGSFGKDGGQGFLILSGNKSQRA